MGRGRELGRCRFVASLYTDSGYIKDIALVPRFNNMVRKYCRCPSGCKNAIIARILSMFIKEQRENRLMFSFNRYVLVYIFYYNQIIPIIVLMCDWVAISTNTHK